MTKNIRQKGAARVLSLLLCILLLFSMSGITALAEEEACTVFIDMQGHGENIPLDAEFGDSLSDVLSRAFGDQLPSEDDYEFLGFSLFQMENPTDGDMQNAKEEINAKVLEDDIVVYAMWRPIGTGENTNENEESDFVVNGSEYTINNAEGWVKFASEVSKGNDFSGMTVKLDRDIEVKQKVGVVEESTQSMAFSGVFDGQNKTIEVSISDTANQGTAPFCYINGATIKNLKVSGSVNGSVHAAGLVGFSSGANNKIENCSVSASVYGGSHVGGILGHGLSSDITISNCVFSGDITGGSDAKGVIFGWGDDGGEKSIENCLYVCQDEQNTVNLDLVKYYQGKVQVTRCYKTTDAGSCGTRVYTAPAEGGISQGLKLADGKTYYTGACYVDFPQNVACTGSEITLDFLSVTAPDGTRLKVGEDYSVSTDPSPVLEKGDYTLTIQGIGSYAGKKSVPFTVVDFYAVNIDKDIEHGTVTADTSAAYETQTVTLTVKPNESYMLKSLSVIYDGGEVEPTENSGIWTFTMPAFDVTVKAEFEPLVLFMGENTVTFQSGDPVTCTFTPEESGVYIFTSSRESEGMDPKIEIFDGDRKIASNDDNMDDGSLDFSCPVPLEGGKTYLVTLYNLYDIPGDITVMVRKSEDMYYVDKKGEVHFVDDYTIIDGSSDYYGNSSSGVYVVMGQVNLDDLYLYDNYSNGLTLILCDGASLNLNGTFDCLNNLDIYGQEKGSGALYSAGDYAGIWVYGNLNIHGGQVTAESVDGEAIYSENGLNISGGQVTAVSENTFGVSCRSNVSLDWTRYTDFILISSIDCQRNVVLRKSFTDGTGSFSQGGYPYDYFNIYMAGKKLYRDAAYSISVDCGVGGRVEADMPKANSGDTVSLTVFPDEGFELDSLTVKQGDTEVSAVKDKNGNYSFKMPDGNVTVRATFRKKPAFMVQSLTLSGQIGVNFYMDLSMLTEDQRKESYVTFKVGNSESEVRDDYDAGAKNRTNEYYGFTCHVNSIQMADTITAIYHYKMEGEEKTVKKTYSVVEYIDSCVSSGQFTGKELALIKSIKDYGYYAQQYLAGIRHFGIGTDYAEITDPYTGYYATDTVKEETSQYQIQISSFSKDISSASYSLSLDSDTSIHLYIRPAAEYKGKFSATVNGKEAEAVPGSDGRYRITISGIPAHMLGDTYKVIIETDSGKMALDVSAMSYVYSCLSRSSAEDAEKKAVAAFYSYYNSADSYKKEHS